MECEKLMHGHKSGRWKTDKATGEKVLVGQSTNHPYKCGRPAVSYFVHGESYTAFATLCKIHKLAAEREGFRVERADDGH